MSINNFILSNAILKIYDELSKVGKKRDIKNDVVINKLSAEEILALYFIRVYIRLSALFNGNVEQIKLWLNGYNKGTGGVPREQIQTQEGLISVMEYLDAI